MIVAYDSPRMPPLTEVTLQPTDWTSRRIEVKTILTEVTLPSHATNVHFVYVCIGVVRPDKALYHEHSGHQRRSARSALAHAPPGLPPERLPPSFHVSMDIAGCSSETSDSPSPPGSRAWSPDSVGSSSFTVPPRAPLADRTAAPSS